jgi:hypothetical protein
MRFEHIIVINEPDADLPLMSVETLQGGLRLLALRPQAFDSAIDAVELAEPPAADPAFRLTRLIRRGSQFVADHVEVGEGGNSFEQIVVAPPDAAGSTRRIDIEAPVAGLLLLRFRYLSTSAASAPQVPDDELRVLAAAWLGADRDFVRALRRLDLSAAGCTCRDAAKCCAPTGRARLQPGRPQGALRGDFRTPEGSYRLTRRNPRSDFFLSMQVSYPNRRTSARAAQRLGAGRVDHDPRPAERAAQAHAGLLRHPRLDRRLHRRLERRHARDLDVVYQQHPDRNRTIRTTSPIEILPDGNQYRRPRVRRRARRPARQRSRSCRRKRSRSCCPAGRAACTRCSASARSPC